ncbi:MAG: DUF6526 family protein, partial [Gemmatimonadales bacterium]
PPWHFFVAPLLLVNVIATAWHAWRHPSPWDLWMIVVAFVLLVAVVTARVQTATVQDRLIRLEMRLRLRELLKGALAGRIMELTTRQLIGLRFASDAEMPTLVERCLSGELKDDEAVKKQVKDWQPDWLRA